MENLPAFVSPLPRQLVFGSGRLEKLGEFAAGLGRVALLVVGGASLAKSGNLQRVERALQASGVKYEAFAGVPAEPTVEWVDRGRAQCRQMGADMVIGVGGGSVVDVAKAIGALAHEEAPTAAFHRGEVEITQPPLPVVAVPTTAGTGAEVTPNAVLTDPQRHYKASLRGSHFMPVLALVDPLLTLSCPPWQTAYSGLDAIVQALESYVSKGANPYSDALALRALELMAPALPRAVEEGEDLAARAAMALGATLAGMALACARLGLVHGLAHPLGHLCGLPHGMICGLLMPVVMEFNLPLAAAKYAQVARSLGLGGPDEAAAAQALIDWMRGLCQRFEIARPLELYGLRPEHYDKIVAETLASGSTKHNPRAVSAAELVQLLDHLRLYGCAAYAEPRAED
jgi:alcohol dehydrogenase class IV